LFLHHLELLSCNICRVALLRCCPLRRRRRTLSSIRSTPSRLGPLFSFLKLRLQRRLIRL
jgi:hypothetical protein